MGKKAHEWHSHEEKHLRVYVCVHTSKKKALFEALSHAFLGLEFFEKTLLGGHAFIAKWYKRKGIVPPLCIIRALSSQELGKEEVSRVH